jgi:hypothetical protein
MAQVVSQWPLTVEDWVHSQASPCSICGEQTSTGAGFLWVLQFPPVGIALQMLHTHSLIYHQCCIILATDSIIR